MKKRIDLEVGMSLIKLADRVADYQDEEALKIIGDIAYELLMNDDVQTSDNPDPLTIVEYTAMLVNALKEGKSVEEVKNSAFRTRLND